MIPGDDRKITRGYNRAGGVLVKGGESKGVGYEALPAGGPLLLLVLTRPLTPRNKKPDDVLQKKDGGIVVGRILKLDAETIEILVNGEKELPPDLHRELNPYTVYKIRLDRIDKSSGEARLGAGRVLHGQRPVLRRDPGVRGSRAARQERSRRRRRSGATRPTTRTRGPSFEEAKRLAAEKKYEQANNHCQMVVEKYSDTPYFDEAKKLVARIAEEIAKENADKKAQLAEKKDDQKKKVDQLKENQEKDLLTKTAELIDEGGRHFLEGLDGEAKNLTRGERAWKAAEVALLTAHRNVEYLLKSNDVDTIKRAKELERQIDHLLVRVYYRLGRMWAVELSYPTALEWLNKAMKVPHDEQMDRQINEILLTISQLKMRERAAEQGVLG